jgi:hypothetical protein
MPIDLWDNSENPRDTMGMTFAKDCWSSLSCHGADQLFQVLKRTELPPVSKYFVKKEVERMMAFPEGGRLFCSQAGSALCLYQATPFGQWPDRCRPEDFVSGAPFLVDKDDAASTFGTFFCWMMAKAEPQMVSANIAMYPDPYRQWAYAYIGVSLWVFGWVNKELFVQWAWERGLLASTWLLKWERWEKLDLEDSGVLSLGNE